MAKVIIKNLGVKLTEEDKKNNPHLCTKSKQELMKFRDPIIDSGTGKGERTFSSTYDIWDSIIKDFYYLSVIAKDPITLNFEHEGKAYSEILNPPKEVKISWNLFRSYNCLDYGCSKCCKKPRFWNVFSPDQMQESLTEYSEEDFSLCIKKDIDINGVKQHLFLEKHTDYHCPHIDWKGEICRIHLTNPIHCALPLIKFKKHKDKVYITREYFGRNWNMQCPARFEPMTEEGFKGTIRMLNRVKHMAEELSIPHIMESIITDCHKMWEIKKNESKVPPVGKFKIF